MVKKIIVNNIDENLKLLGQNLDLVIESRKNNKICLSI